MIKLRKLEMKDVEGMYEWIHDPETQKYFRFSGANKNYKDIEGFIQTAKIIPEDGKSVHFAVVNDTDEYLGTISLKNFDLIAKNAEFAIGLRKCAQRQGIGSEATREILKVAFQDFKLERIYLNVFSDNRKAIHMYEELGFICEGEFRKHLFLRGEYKTLKWYAMLKNEYMDI